MMIAAFEAEDAATSFNLNTEDEKYKYENQNERRGAANHKLQAPHSQAIIADIDADDAAMLVINQSSKSKRRS
jgi:hypothetical protein